MQLSLFIVAATLSTVWNWKACTVEIMWLEIGSYEFQPTPILKPENDAPTRCIDGRFPVKHIIFHGTYLPVSRRGPAYHQTEETAVRTKPLCVADGIALVWCRANSNDSSRPFHNLRVFEARETE